MDGLSGAASGMAVVSLAVQLGGSMKQLYDFWGSVKEAPEDVRAITTELKLLWSVLAEMASEEQHAEPDPTLTTALETCCGSVSKLAHLTNDMEPGFASKSLRIRKWTAFKAVLKDKKIQKFQKVLNGLKLSLMLAQQNHDRRLNRIWRQSQEQNVTTITEHVSSLRLEQMSASVTTVSNSSLVGNDHTNALRAEASRICRPIGNPVQRAGFELSSDMAVQDLAKNISKDHSTNAWPLANPDVGHSASSYSGGTLRRFRQQTWRVDKQSIQQSITQTMFGVVTTASMTCLLRSKCVDDNALNDEENQYEHESSIKIMPAQWLLKLGFNYAYNFSTHDSSNQGWQYSLKPINIVPDDALIFKFCRMGNVEKVRKLILGDFASVRDVNSKGYTALHVAARSHRPELCKFLIKAGADKTARTFDPLGRLSPLEMSGFCANLKGRLEDAIDTCRIFEDSLDFWDKDGDGWDLLALLFRTNRDTSFEAGLMFLRWLLQSSSSEIKANYHPEQVYDALHSADSGTADAVRLLFELGPPGAIDNITKTSNSDFTPLLEFVAHRRWDQVKVLLALGANPHLISFNTSYSPRAESPLSMAMYSSWAFRSFREALCGANLHFEDFVRQELEPGCPLLNAGWRMDTLLALFELDFELDFEPPGPSKASYCHDCGSKVYWFLVQPYWQCMLEDKFNQQRFCSDSDVSDEESLTDNTDGTALSHDPVPPEDEAAESDEESFTGENTTASIVFDKKEIWCIWCWYDYKRTGSRRRPAITETDDDFSPFLFNT